MMSSAVKRSKRTPRADDESTPSADDVDSSSESRTTSSKTLCIVCGDPASKRIDKDRNYDTMLQLYWCTLGVDVKPEACQKTDLCEPCFTKMVKYFETNETMVFFESYFRSLRLEMFKATLKGITKWEQSGKPLTKIQQDIRNKHGDKPDLSEQEQESLKQTLKKYKVDYCENRKESSGSEDSKSKARVVIKLAKKTTLDKAKKPDKINLRELATITKSSDDDSD